jgi:uncharacterized membrane protein YfcA
LSAWHAVAIVAAGVGAGIANAIVGSGTLITFPTLLAFGYGPVTANVSNTVGLVFGNVTSMIGYRPEMAGQRARGLRLGLASMLGATGGAILLLALPACRRSSGSACSRSSPARMSRSGSRRATVRRRLRAAAC